MSIEPEQRPIPETFPEASKFFDLEGTPIVIISGGGAWSGMGGKLKGPWPISSAEDGLPARLSRSGFEITEDDFRRLAAALQDTPIPESAPFFLEGTRFFSDYGGSGPPTAPPNPLEFQLPSFPPGTEFFEVDGKPVVVMPGGDAWSYAVSPPRFAPLDFVYSEGVPISQAEFRVLCLPPQFPLGTKFFCVNGQPVACDPSLLRCQCFDETPPRTFDSSVAVSEGFQISEADFRSTWAWIVHQRFTSKG